MTDTPWPQQRRAAISLTFDDVKASHPALVAPLLADYDVRGVFYTPIYSGLLRGAEDWRQVAAAGHELGNHSIFHPCQKNPKRDWPDKSYDLYTYSRKRFRDEMIVSNEVLALIDGISPDGKAERTYGNTCHCNVIGSGDSAVRVDENVDDLFLAVRGEVRQSPIAHDNANLMNLGTVGIDHRSAEDIIALIDEARAAGGWYIFTAHDVNENGDGLSMQTSVLKTLCTYLSKIETKSIPERCERLRKRYDSLHQFITYSRYSAAYDAFGRRPHD